MCFASTCRRSTTRSSTLTQQAWHWARSLFSRNSGPELDEIGPANGRTLQEVQQAFQGQRSEVVRLNPKGETIVSVAIPIQRFRSVRGVLLLSTQGATSTRSSPRSGSRSCRSSWSPPW